MSPLGPCLALAKQAMSIILSFLALSSEGRDNTGEEKMVFFVKVTTTGAIKE